MCLSTPGSWPQWSWCIRLELEPGDLHFIKTTQVTLVLEVGESDGRNVDVSAPLERHCTSPPPVTADGLIPVSQLSPAPLPKLCPPPLSTLHITSVRLLTSLLFLVPYPIPLYTASHIQHANRAAKPPQEPSPTISLTEYCWSFPAGSSSIASLQCRRCRRLG